MEYGFILTFRITMHLKDAIAGTLRAIRTQREFRYVDLADASFKTAISKLERGKAGVTIEQLDRLATSLGFDTLAFLALCLSARDDIRLEGALERAKLQLDAFEKEGGLDLLSKQFEGKALMHRGRGKPLNEEGVAAVRDLKAMGMSRADAARQLGLAYSTVVRYWKKS
jgi:transcriptional regulator with XRE-family HTH domain